MSEADGQFAESTTRWLGRPRRYSPFNRSHGLRRVPDEPIGLAFLSSLILHAVLIWSLVRLTDAPAERPGADVSVILADLAAASPAGAPARVAAPEPAPPEERPAAERSAVKKASPLTPAAGSSRREGGPSAPIVTPPPAPAPPSRIATAKVPAVAPAPLPVAPAGLVEDGPTLISDPAASSTFDIDTPLDAGWPEPPPAAFAIPNPTLAAKTLTSVPLLRDPARAAVEPVPAGILAPEPARLPERPVPAATLDGPGVDDAQRLAETVPSSADPTPEPTAPATPPATSRPTVAQVPIAPDPAWPPARPVVTRSDAHPGSPFGLGLERARVRLDGPRTWVTDQPIRTVSGTVMGGVPERLVLYVNGIATDMTSARRTFETAVLLRPGANEVRAVVTGPTGLQTEDTITVQYVPRPSSSIALTSPPDGLTLGPDDPPVVVVEGAVDDQAATSVWIVANDRRIPVATSEGRFRHILLLPDPLVHLWAETSSGGAVHRSGAVTIRTTGGARPPSGVLVMQWPAGTEGSSVEVTATWRAHPERLDTIVRTMRLPAVGKTAGGAASNIFYLRGLKPGVYTLILRYRGAAPLGDVRPTLYLPDKDHLTPRALNPVPLNGAGRRVLTKVLMPHGVLWNQENWFSGRSESVDTVTKFRIPEGISWVERKADLP
ncbi:MAG: hypothetical protein ACREKQ_10800 [Candidatus Rokuibacteriota bacterium]